MCKIIKLMKKFEQQELQLEKQEEFLIGKMEELEALSVEHEKLNHMHISLTNDYDNLKKDNACATNSFLCVASLQQENCNLKAQLGMLTSKQVNLQKSHEKLLCSHEHLIESHAMLEISHEVILTMVKSYQSHTCNCTSTQMSIDLSCANICCSQVKSSCDEHIIVETCDDFIASENDNLMREVEKLKNDLRLLKGKGHVQPSQDNRDDMVKKLEKGSTVTCAKSPCNKIKKIHDKSNKQTFKKKAQVMCFECSLMGHLGSECPSKKHGETTLSRRQTRLSHRKCFGCMEEGHKIASCPKKRNGMLASQNRRLWFGKPEVLVYARKVQANEQRGKSFVAAYDRDMSKYGSTRRQIKYKERRIKYRICYTCRTKGHIGKDCPMAQVSIPKLVHIDSSTMKATNDPCADKVISSSSVNTKFIWVPKSCLTNIEGPNKIWENRTFRFAKPDVPVSPGKSEEVIKDSDLSVYVADSRGLTWWFLDVYFVSKISPDKHNMKNKYCSHVYVVTSPKSAKFLENLSSQQEKSVVGLSGIRSDSPVKIMFSQRSAQRSPTGYSGLQ
ncbi:hypothetical protein EJB05_56901, partial [Eragrostis curvula]